MKRIIFFLGFFLGAIYTQAQTANAVSNGNWNQTSTWDCGCVPDANYDVVISGYQVDVTDAQAAKSVLLTDDPGRNTQLDINNGTLTVSNDFTVDVNNDNRHMDVIIQGTGVLNVMGNVLFDRAINNWRNKRMQLHMTDNAVFNVTGDFDFIYGDASSNESSYEIWMENNARINIRGDFNFQQTDDGNDATLYMEDNSYIDVDGNMLASLDRGDITELLLNNNAVLDVAGNLSLDVERNNAADRRFNVYLRNSARLLVGGDLNIYQDRSRDLYFNTYDASAVTVSGDMNITQNNSNIWFTFNNSSSVNVGGRVVINKTGGKDLEFILNNSPTVTVGKDFYAELVLKSTVYF
ncbi:MAG: hypothetical protein D6707_08980, partial [Bacteroidetes bacterium]